MVDLYHGTSTLFLDSILQNGLAGINPVTEWQLLELSQEVYALSEAHLQKTPLFQKSSSSFQRMTEQANSGRMNFQHGDTYLSASKRTAVNYALGKRYGSELLTYTVDFWQELIRHNISAASEELRRKYPRVYGLFKLVPSPLLIKVSGLDSSMLVDEHGNSPDNNLARIIDVAESFSSDFQDTALGQINFRLKVPVQTDRLTCWLINVQKWNPYFPEFNLYELASTAQII
jgi:hypothetical protein